MALIYKVVESLQVDAESVEAELNEWTAKGWDFYSIQFAVKESSRRPTLAFILFTKEVTEDAAMDESFDFAADSVADAGDVSDDVQ